MKTTEPVEVVRPPFALLNAKISRKCPQLPEPRVQPPIQPPNAARPRLTGIPHKPQQSPEHTPR